MVSSREEGRLCRAPSLEALWGERGLEEGAAPFIILVIIQPFNPSQEGDRRREAGPVYLFRLRRGVINNV